MEKAIITGITGQDGASRRWTPKISLSIGVRLVYQWFSENYMTKE